DVSGAGRRRAPDVTGRAGERGRSGVRYAGRRSNRPAHGGSRRCHLLLLLRELPCAFCQAAAGLSPAEPMTDAATIRERFRERAFVVDEAFATALQIMLA